MELALSYFYQIRNFKPYMIPVSTAVWDPQWFHKDKTTMIFKDKNNVYNGIRFDELAPGETCKDLCKGKDNCNIKKPGECLFLQNYRRQLEKLDFKNLINKCNILANNIKRIERFFQDPIIVFMVYETYTNKCSERDTILSVFNEHGLKISELKYPINENYT